MNRSGLAAATATLAAFASCSDEPLPRSIEQPSTILVEEAPRASSASLITLTAKARTPSWSSGYVRPPRRSRRETSREVCLAKLASPVSYASATRPESNYRCSDTIINRVPTDPSKTQIWLCSERILGLPPIVPARPDHRCPAV